MSYALKAARMGPGGYRRTSRIVQGDPGLFGGLIGGVKGAIGAVLKGGNPLSGAISGAVSGYKGTPSPSPRPQLPALPMPGVPSVQLPVTVSNPVAAAIPFGSTGLSVEVPASMNGAGAPRGYHLNKSAYWLRDGTFVPARSRYVKNRRRNPLNPRALRSAVQRIDAGKKWQGTLSEISTAKYTKAGNRKACA